MRVRNTRSAEVQVSLLFFDCGKTGQVIFFVFMQSGTEKEDETFPRQIWNMFFSCHKQIQSSSFSIYTS